MLVYSWKNFWQQLLIAGLQPFKFGKLSISANIVEKTCFMHMETTVTEYTAAPMKHNCACWTLSLDRKTN